MIISDDDNLNELTMSHAERIFHIDEIDNIDGNDADAIIIFFNLYGVNYIVDELKAANEKHKNVYFEIEGTSISFWRIAGLLS